MSKRILVTGAAGYIGGTFTYEALKRNHIIFGLDNFSNSTPKYIDFFKERFHENFYFSELDLSISKIDLKKIIFSFKPDVVLHFAGLKAVGESEQKPDLYWKNNVNATLNILDCIDKNTDLIFSSSATVYGDSSKQPLTEKSRIQATSVYGETKIASEKLIKEASSFKGIKAISLRYFNPVGAHKDFVISEDFLNKPNNLMPKLIESAKKNINSIDIYGNDYATRDGTGERDYIHIQDLVEGHLKAIEKLKVIENIEFYNLGTGNPTSVMELIDTFNKVNKLNIKKNFVARRKGDVEVCYTDPSKAMYELEWKAKYNLAEMCRDAWVAVNYELK